MLKRKAMTEEKYSRFFKQNSSEDSSFDCLTNELPLVFEDITMITSPSQCLGMTGESDISATKHEYGICLDHSTSMSDPRYCLDRYENSMQQNSNR